MALTKVITPGSQDFNEPVVQPIKISSRGLRGADLDAFVKRASVQFIDKIAGIRKRPGEELVHLLAVGAKEYYGSNRNGDAFTEEVCRACHPSFQKYARWYRDHANKDPSKGRGMIRATAYNGDMKRIELLVGLNATKEAADRNGGLVADEEMEKLDKGEDIPVSMACRVSHDVCSSCGNKAKSRAEYCDDAMCKHGGCKTNLAKTFDDGHTLHVTNPDPSFFDISKVFRPADRIAYTLGCAKYAADYRGMMKAASEHYGDARSSAALADQLGVTPPLWVLTDGPWSDPRVVAQLKVASSLMQLEDAATEPERMASPLSRACLPAVQPLRQDAPDVRKGPFKLAHVVTALAAEKCMLPLDTFVAMLTGEFTPKTAAAVDRVAEQLPGMYNRLASDPRLEEELRVNPYVPGGPAPRRVQHWVQKHSSEWALDRPSVVERLQLSVLRHPAPPEPCREMAKVAEAGGTEELAKQYGLYQLAFLAAQADDPDAGFMQAQAIRANFSR